MGEGREGLGREARVVRRSRAIGLKRVHGAVPAYARTDAWLVQEYVIGAELTVAVLRTPVGHPLRIALPEGTAYSFARKYLLPVRRVPINNAALAEQLSEQDPLSR